MDPARSVAWTNLRFDYYASGRSAVLCQSPRIGGILLGYAIESSLKQLLSDQLPKKLINSHNLFQLYEQYQLQGFAPLEMSEDFLKFANDRLDQRYPTGLDRVMKWHAEEDRFQDFPADNIVLYDDVVCQLDDIVMDKFQCPSSSILIRGALNIETYPGRALFHCNHHAANRFDKILTELSADSARKIECKNFAEKRQELWNFNYMLMWIPESFTVRYAKDYAYPNWEPGDEGSKVATLVFRQWLPNLPGNNADSQLDPRS